MTGTSNTTLSWGNDTLSIQTPKFSTSFFRGWDLKKGIGKLYPCLLFPLASKVCDYERKNKFFKYGFSRQQV